MEKIILLKSNVIIVIIEKTTLLIDKTILLKSIVFSVGEAGAVGRGDVDLPGWRLCRHQMEVDKTVNV